MTIFTVVKQKPMKIKNNFLVYLIKMRTFN